MRGRLGERERRKGKRERKKGGKKRGTKKKIINVKILQTLAISQRAMVT